VTLIAGGERQRRSAVRASWWCRHRARALRVLCHLGGDIGVEEPWGEHVVVRSRLSRGAIYRPNDDASPEAELIILSCWLTRPRARSGRLQRRVSGKKLCQSGRAGAVALSGPRLGPTQWHTDRVRGDGAGLPAGYVELQLRLARRAATLGTHDFLDAVAELTNLRRRLGFGEPADAPHDPWARYLDGLEVQPDLAGQVRWTIEFAESNDAPAPPSAAVARAGPFSAHVHDDILSTHFVPRAANATSPLHRSCLAQRRRELWTVLAAAIRLHPEIRRVRGTSWLYSTRSYRAIFPPMHVASATVRTHVYRFQGSSSWGQFLDHRGDVKAELAARFVAAVDGYDGTAPWTLFPIPTLVVDSPIEAFGFGRRSDSVVE